MDLRERSLREEIVRLAASLFARGFVVGSAGNISVLLEDGLLITPTNASFGALTCEEITKLDLEGRPVSGRPPSKELDLHRGFYDTRPAARAVVHLHSTYCTAYACLCGTDAEDSLPAVTPYSRMRLGRVARLPYFRPGDPAGGDLVRSLGGRHAAALLANHGSVVCGTDLASAVWAAEELEETAKVLFLLHGRDFALLTSQQAAELDAGASATPDRP